MEENKFEFLEKELETLKKDYGRLCQNDSVMRREQSVAFKRLDKQDEEIKELKLIITKLHQERQRLYQTGFSNGVEVARKEYADEFKKLEDRGLISCHGFLKSESNDTLDKLAESMFNQLGIHTDKLEPVSATKMADEAWYKWVEANVGKFERRNLLTKEEVYNLMKATQIDPVEADYYNQVNKTEEK